MRDEHDRQRELFRLASCIADGTSVDAGDPASSPAVDAHERDAFALIGRVTRSFRRADHAACAGTPAPAFHFGGLAVFEKIAEGSYGAVHRAWDPMLGQYVALKLLKADTGLLADTFLAEARSLARLRHPNILNVFGAAAENGRTGLWTEWVSGHTLQDLVAQGNPLSADEVRAIGRDVCDALGYIHRQQFTHGDVKPANIGRDDSGRVVLMDFGAARPFAAAHSGGTVQGSRRYLAPEVLRGAPPAPASDIYALGVTLFVLLTGVYPDDDSASSRAAGMPRSLRVAIEKALREDPRQRHADAEAFAAALSKRMGTARAAVRGALAVAMLALLVSGVAMYRATYVPVWITNSILYRAAAEGYRPLADGSPLRLGDTFALEFQTSHSAWLYVIDDDGSETPSVLFPSAELATANPIRPGAPQRFPGTTLSGETRDWQVNTQSASEHVLVVAASAPLPNLELASQQWQHATDAAALPSPAPMQRGAYGLAPVRPGPAARKPLQALVAELERLRANGEVRVWEYTFPRSDAVPSQERK